MVNHERKTNSINDIVSNFCSDNLDDECRQLCVKSLKKWEEKVKFHLSVEIANKASDIRKLLNTNVGDEEISTRLVLNSNVKGTNLSETKSLKMAQNKNILKSTANILKAMNNSRKF